MNTPFATYPTESAERDPWILSRRPKKHRLDPRIPYSFLVEDERSADGEIVRVATLFLTNRECSWRCLMCDLWQNTLSGSVAAGDIPAQISHALQRLPAARQIKLYNSGSFFDPLAIPVADYSEIANITSSFDRVIVESHPALIGGNCFSFQESVTKLEVAMGLETAHPQILERLNKRMTLGQFSMAAEKLRSRDIDLRVFILVKPPFMQEDAAFEWAAKSLDFAFNCGATAATLIPTRAGNGAMDELQSAGDFTPPGLETLESSMEYGLSLHRGRVFVDLWDVARLSMCQACKDLRISRIMSMNLLQSYSAGVRCEVCG